MKEKILQVENLAISFKTNDGLVKAVRNIDFDLYRGETLCIVGESGSGKSVTCRAIMGILAPNAQVASGSILFEGQDLIKTKEDQFHKLRGQKLGMIFQDPMSSLNPIMKIGKQISESIIINRQKFLKEKIGELALDQASKKVKNEEDILKIKQIKKEYRQKIKELLKTKIKWGKWYKWPLNIFRHLSMLIESYFNLRVEQKVAIVESLPEYLRLKKEYKSRTVSKYYAKKKALSLIEEVGIPDGKKRFNQYPFQFSGGMRQRIVIAIALAASPELLICDEPTTALDVTIQAQILELINKLKKERNLSIIFITHDLGVVANMADRVAIMYAGKIVEYGTCNEIFYQPEHPYTWALLSSMPSLTTCSKQKLSSIPGTPPNMLFPPEGDAFASRNKYALKIDFVEHPPFFKLSDTHYAATWLLDPQAPKIEKPTFNYQEEE